MKIKMTVQEFDETVNSIRYKYKLTFENYKVIRDNSKCIGCGECDFIVPKSLDYEMKVRFDI